MRGVWSSWVALAVAGALTGCGGGGGGGGAAGGGPVVSRIGLGSAGERTGPSDFDAESNRNYGLQAVGATTAHAAGRNGAGVTVGIVDTGIDLQHKDFEGAISAASIDIVGGSHEGVDDQGGHGTSVAGVVGARRDGYDAVGVAPESTLLAVRADATGSCASKCSFFHSDLARATDYAVANGAKIINYSLGGDSISAEFRASLEAAAAADRIVVAAAGNSGDADPIDPALWTATAGAAGLGIAVGAVDASNNLAWFSNKAGIAKDRFLVAPGVAITTSRNGGGVRTVNGTSFAAPHVAGAAAVVWGAAPYLTGAQVADILLTSATDLGAAGTDEIYGRGLLNLDAALQPLGEMTVPTEATVAEGGAPLSSTSLSLGSAFGTAAPTGLDQAILLDAYGRPFSTDLGKLVGTARPRHNLAGWLDQSGESVTTRIGSASLTLSSDTEESEYALREQPGDPIRQPRFALSSEIGGTRFAMARGYSLGMLTGLSAAMPNDHAPGLAGDALSSPYLALAGDGTSMASGHDLGDGYSLSMGMTEELGDGLLSAPERRALLSEGTKRFADGSIVGVQLGSLSESDGPLASSAGGAFAFDGDADTVFTGLFAATPLSGRATLFGRWGQGFTDGSALSGGMWRGADTFRSESFALGATVRDDRGTWSFAASRPLRVADGSAVLAVPVGRAMDGTILYRETQVDLSPSGAETDLEVSWTTQLAPGQRLVLGGMMALEPGHDANAEPTFAAGAKYRIRW